MISWFRAQFAAVKGLIVDEVLSEIVLDSRVRGMYFWCQLRQRKSPFERYVVIKSKGGDATVWVTLDLTEERALAGFLGRVTVDDIALVEKP